VTTQKIIEYSTDFRHLQRLSKEFGFAGFATNLSDFHPSINLKKENEAMHERIAALEEKVEQQNHVIVMLQTKSLSSPQISESFVAPPVSETDSFRKGIREIEESAPLISESEQVCPERC
jgi:hypothetical protein